MLVSPGVEQQRSQTVKSRKMFGRIRNIKFQVINLTLVAEAAPAL